MPAFEGLPGMWRTFAVKRFDALYRCMVCQLSVHNGCSVVQCSLCPDPQNPSTMCTRCVASCDICSARACPGHVVEWDAKETRLRVDRAGVKLPSQSQSRLDLATYSRSELGGTCFTICDVCDLRYTTPEEIQERRRQFEEEENQSQNESLDENGNDSEWPPHETDTEEEEEDSYMEQDDDGGDGDGDDGASSEPPPDSETGRRHAVHDLNMFIQYGEVQVPSCVICKERPGEVLCCPRCYWEEDEPLAACCSGCLFVMCCERGETAGHTTDPATGLYSTICPEHAYHCIACAEDVPPHEAVDRPLDRTLVCASLSESELRGIPRRRSTWFERGTGTSAAYGVFARFCPACVVDFDETEAAQKSEVDRICAEGRDLRGERYHSFFVENRYARRTRRNTTDA